MNCVQFCKHYKISDNDLHEIKYSNLREGSYEKHLLVTLVFLNIFEVVKIHLKVNLFLYPIMLIV